MKAKVEETVEEVEEEEVKGQGSTSESDSDDEDGKKDGEEDGTSPSGGYRLSRNEKKARKAVLKHGMKQIPGVARVTIRKSKQIVFVVPKADVFKSTTSDTYVIFGEAKIEDVTQKANTAAAQRFTKVAEKAGAVLPEGVDMEGLMSGLKAAGLGGGGGTGVGGGNVDEVEEVDTSDLGGVTEDDINLVMKQVNCSRAKAVAALKANNSDIVEAIMQLSSG